MMPKSWIAVSTLIACAAILAMLEVANGASSIDTNYPSSGQDVIATPIAGNFATAKSEISALQSKFPASTQVYHVPLWGSSSGALTNHPAGGQLFQDGSGNLFYLGSNATGWFLSSTVDPIPAIEIQQTNTSPVAPGNILTLKGSDGTKRWIFENDGSTIGSSNDSLEPMLSLENTGSSTAPVLRINPNSATGLISFNADGAMTANSANSTSAATFQQTGLSGSIIQGKRTGLLFFDVRNGGPLYRVLDSEGIANDTRVVSSGTHFFDKTAATTTSNATITTTLSIDLITDSAVNVQANITGVVSSGTDDGDAVGYTINATAKREGAASSLIGSLDKVAREDSTLTSADATIDVDDATDTLRIRVTGISGDTFHWNTVVRVNESIQ